MVCIAMTMYLMFRLFFLTRYPFFIFDFCFISGLGPVPTRFSSSVGCNLIWCTWVSLRNWCITKQTDLVSKGILVHESFFYRAYRTSVAGSAKLVSLAFAQRFWTKIYLTENLLTAAHQKPTDIPPPPLTLRSITPFLHAAGIE